VETILSVENLQVSFDTYAGEVEAVRDISFSLGRGEVLAIVGESGSGKSVTVQALMGLTPSPPGRIKGGRALFEGTDLLAASEAELSRIRGKGISMIFQDPMTALNPSMTVGAQIAEVLHQHLSLTRAKARSRVVELLRLVGIPEPEERLRQYPHQFSGGMRQRIVIAIAIANNPAILLADEPTTALDVTIQSQIFRLIRDVRTTFGTAMILITHDLGLVAGIADRIVVMYAGRVVEEGATNQIFEAPQHPYTLGLLGAVPNLADDSMRPLRTIEGLPPLLIDPPGGCAFADRCPYRMRICRAESPPDFASLPGNRAACWLHHDQAGQQRQVFLGARAKV
jgi:oligopeptide transport system ATP-binding protein